MLQIILLGAKPDGYTISWNNRIMADDYNGDVFIGAIHLYKDSCERFPEFEKLIHTQVCVCEILSSNLGCMGAGMADYLRCRAVVLCLEV